MHVHVEPYPGLGAFVALPPFGEAIVSRIKIRDIAVMVRLVFGTGNEAVIDGNSKQRDCCRYKKRGDKRSHEGPPLKIFDYLQNTSFFWILFRLYPTGRTVPDMPADNVENGKTFISSVSLSFNPCLFSVAQSTACNVFLPAP